MTFKKTISLLMILSIVLGLMSFGVFAADPETAPEALHAIGAIANASKGYIYADVMDNGTLIQKVFITGDSTATTPYSMKTADYDGTNGQQITCYYKSAMTPVGYFFFTHKTSSGTSCFLYNFSNANGWNANTSSQRTNNWENLFNWDHVNQKIYQQVPKSEGEGYDSYVLVCKKIDLTAGGSAWRMVFVPEADANAEGNFIAKLGNKSACDFGTEYEKNADNHWLECSCGAKKDEAAHTHEWKGDKDDHYQECVCGDKIEADTHTLATEWSKDDDNHWHACSCGFVYDKDAHNYVDGTPDYANNNLPKTCEGCGDVKNTPLSHDCIADETKWYVEGENHYRKCSLCGEKMDSTVAAHTFPETDEKDGEQHWKECSVCDALTEKVNHDHKLEKNDDQHWAVCVCGDETTKVDHTYGNWAVTTPATESTPGVKTGECECGAKKTVDIPPVLTEGKYYLTAKVGGVDYYYIHGTYTNTAPYSLPTTTDKAESFLVDIKYLEDNMTYTLNTEIPKAVMIYMNDQLKGEGNDGVIDMSVTTSTAANMVEFSWDAQNKVLYQMEGDVKYVMAMTKLTVGESEAIRIIAVPYSELSSSVVAVTLELYHVHDFAEEYESDKSGHWKSCECGDKKDEGDHLITKWTETKKPTATQVGTKEGKCDVCGFEVTSVIPATGTASAPAPKDGHVNQLSAMINGVRYYYRHTETGESVTSTTPYSLYVTTDPTKAIAITVKEDEDGFILCYDRGGKNLRLYINENGVGITASEDPAMVRFYWDAQNQALYQMEGGIKYYLAFKTLNNELRITSVAETEALAGNGVHLMKLHGDSSASTGDNALLTLMGTLLAVSVCAMGAVITAKKKFF